MIDELLLVYHDNVCIQIFSAVFCITLNFTADTSKLASALGTQKYDSKRWKERRRGGGGGGGERDGGEDK